MNRDIPSIKKELRQRVRQALSALDPTQKRRQSQSVITQIEADEKFREARNVAVFWPLEDEVDLKEAIRRWSADKNIFLPVIEGDDMSFHKYSCAAPLAKGKLGIWCPVAGEAVKPAKLDVVIVPGVAFDRSGDRMGRGKGFYDRYLKNTDAYKIGICFACQLVDWVPAEPHDITMDKIISAAEK